MLKNVGYQKQFYGLNSLGYIVVVSHRTVPPPFNTEYSFTFAYDFTLSLVFCTFTISGKSKTSTCTANAGMVMRSRTIFCYMLYVSKVFHQVPTDVVAGDLIS